MLSELRNKLLLQVKYLFNLLEKKSRLFRFCFVRYLAQDLHHVCACRPDAVLSVFLVQITIKSLYTFRTREQRK